jgi:hypothetical protein
VHNGRRPHRIARDAAPAAGAVTAGRLWDRAKNAAGCVRAMRSPVGPSVGPAARIGVAMRPAMRSRPAAFLARLAPTRAFAEAVRRVHALPAAPVAVHNGRRPHRIAGGEVVAPGEVGRQRAADHGVPPRPDAGMAHSHHAETPEAVIETGRALGRLARALGADLVHLHGPAYAGDEPRAEAGLGLRGPCRRDLGRRGRRPEHRQGDAKPFRPEPAGAGGGMRMSLRSGGAPHVLMTADAVGGVWQYSLDLALDVAEAVELAEIVGVRPLPGRVVGLPPQPAVIGPT